VRALHINNDGINQMSII